MKAKGTKIPKLEKSHSVVNITMSEQLVKEGFDIIFTQFKRYIKFMKEFEPIDWEFYVTKRNSQRKKGDTIEPITENQLPDEGESTASDSDKEKKEEKKDETKEEKKEEAPKEEVKEPPV